MQSNNRIIALEVNQTKIFFKFKIYLPRAKQIDFTRLVRAPISPNYRGDRRENQSVSLIKSESGEKIEKGLVRAGERDE
jgi:hypothetical protein